MEYYAFDVHPSDPNRLIAGAQDNGKQVRSTTNAYRITGGADGMQIAYKRTNPSIVLGGIQNGMIDRSTNGGDTWQRVFQPPQGERTLWETPVVNDSATPNRFYTGTQFLYRSTDDGQSWSRVSNVDLTNGVGAIAAIAVAPSNSNVIYTGSSGGVVYVSTGAGSAWTDCSPSRTNSTWSGYVSAIVVHPTRPEVVWVSFAGFGQTKVVRSTDFGMTWWNLTSNLPRNTSVTCMLLHPRLPDVLFAATDTGVFMLHGTRWYRLGIGLPGTPCTMLRTSGNYLYVSTFGRGVWRVDLPDAVFAESEVRLIPGNIRAQMGGVARIEAQLWNVLNGTAISGKPLRFFVSNTLVATVVTNSSGVAVHHYRVPDSATVGQRYSVRVVREGDSTADAAEAEGTIHVERIRTRVAVSDQTGRWGQMVDLTATVTREDDGRALSGVPVRFFVRDEEVGTATTNSAGRASVPYRITFLETSPLRAEVSTDTRYEGASGSATLRATYPILQGTIQLRDYLGPRDLPSVLDIFDQHDPNNWKRIPIQLDTKGGSRIEVPIFGDVRVSVKVSHWLRQTLILKVADVTTAVWDLINGDVDEDNEISLMDFGYVSAAFGATPGQPSWFDNADLDGDEEVSLLDFGILVRNFGLIGDEP